MEYWKKLAAQCEDLMRQHDATKTEGARMVLIKMAARKFDQAAALLKSDRLS